MGLDTGLPGETAADLLRKVIKSDAQQWLSASIGISPGRVFQCLPIRAICLLIPGLYNGKCSGRILKTCPMRCF